MTARWIVVAAAIALAVVGHGIASMIGASEPAVPRLGDRTPAPAPRLTATTASSVEPRLPAPVRPTPDVAVAEHAATEPDRPRTARPAPSGEELRDRLQVFFAAEAVDPAWHRAAADALATGIRAVLPAGSSLVRIDCRETLCRVETHHVGSEEFREYVQTAFLERDTQVAKAGFFASLLDEPRSDGATAAVVYVVREGKDMPTLDALFASR